MDDRTIDDRIGAPMKAITIWQPWADLIIRGYKHFETRGWATPYTGPLAIHAAKFRKIPHEIYMAIAGAIGMTPDEYPGSWLFQLEMGAPAERFGAILGWGHLGQAIPTASRSWDNREQVLGNFEPFRYAWPITDLHPLTWTVPAKGRQSLWLFTPPI